MSKVQSPSTQAAAPSRRYHPALLLLFAGSGCSALIYEIVWYQLLQLVIGSTAVSLGVLLATFMGGLCLGSLLLPRYLPADRHLLRAYAMIEIGIGVCGVLVHLGMPLISGIYVAAAAHGMPSILMRAVICSICLLPPTVLMGASLPAAARWLETSAEGVSWMGLLYGANTAGAVFGCLLAGFYLLRVFSMAAGTLTAALLNGGVALLSLLLARMSPHKVQAEAPPAPGAALSGYWPAYVAIALSGASALGAEVVWTRLLGLMLGATVYTFSIILAVFLVGLGIGSAVGSILVRGMAKPQAVLGWCQMALAATVAWTAWQLSTSLPYWPINPFLSTSLWYTFQLDLVRCLWAILPAALLWGASFPLALAAVAPRGGDPGRLVGKVYAANTAGAILGALAFSIVLIPWIGTRRCESVMIWIGVVSALVALVPVVFRARSLVATGALVFCTVCAAAMAAHVSDVPGELIAYGRRMTTSTGQSKILQTAEGMNSSIAISQWNDGAIQFHVSGKVEASTEPYDMRLQRMLGHLPSLIHGQPKSALIVGFGAGVTAGTFVLQPSIQRIVICEMEPLIPKTAKQYFHKEHYDVLDDHRTQVYYDDARHYVLTTPEKFDIITSDPIHPFVKGSATLYSKEYFEMVKDRLNPGGIVTQWVPLYETDMETVKSEIATFFNVFPDGAIFANELNGGGYDLVMLGWAAPTKIDVDAVEQRFESAPFRAVAQSLGQVGFNSAIQMLGTYAGRASDLQQWLADAQINRDGDLRLQYLAGMALNDSQENDIYGSMMPFRRYPDSLFTVSDQRREMMMSSFASHGQ